MLPIRKVASSISETHSSVSGFARTLDTTLKKDRWRCSWHFIVSMLSYCMTSHSYASFVGTKTQNEPNLIQHFISFLLFGMPLMYMQIFLGQYTQMGMFYIKYCVPLFKGVAHAFMACVLLESILAGFITTDELMYFLLSFQEVLPWSVCPHEYKHLCTLNKTSQENYSHPALIFWRYVYMDDPVIDINKVETYNIPSLQRIVALLTTWTLTFGIVCVCYYYHRKCIRIMFYMYAFGTIAVFLAIVSNPAALTGLSKLLEMQIEDFYSPVAWKKSMVGTIEGLNLATLYHMYAGAFLPQKAQAGALSVACVFFLLLFKVILSTIGSMSESLIQHNTGLPTLQSKYGISKYTLALFITIPQGLSYLSLPQLWTAIYFATNIILSICNQLLHLISMQVAVTDLYPNFYKFRVYVFGVISICSFFFGLSILPDCVYAVYQIIFNDVGVYFKCTTTLSLSVAIFLVYGVTNLSDDIHFMMGSQPTKYWKICWYLNPLVLTISITFTIILVVAKLDGYLVIAMAVTLILLSPVLVFAVIESLGYIKKRNLLGVIQSSELWGPPDADDRVVRRMFNPRLETRYQAYKMICEHFCLSGNKYLKNIINQENTMRRDYFAQRMESKGIRISITQDF